MIVHFRDYGVEPEFDDLDAFMHDDGRPGVGQAARGVLNSVFLYHAVQAGLDMAIVNPAHITPYAEKIGRAHV